MKNLSLAIAMLLTLGVACLPVRAQTTKPEKPTPPEKLVDPAADALQTYLFDQANNELMVQAKNGDKTIKDIELSNPDKKEYAEAVVTYMLWSRYLEKKSVEKFGKEEGKLVQGHIRTYQDQYALDLKRVRDANVQYNNDRNAATIYLRVELNRPDNLQVGDRFNFLDVYEMTKTASGWKLDFLKTYKVIDPEQEDNYKLEMLAFPRMAGTLKLIAEGIVRGTYKTADEAKNEYDTRWAHVYDEPIRRTLKPGETMPAETSKSGEIAPTVAPKTK